MDFTHGYWGAVYHMKSKRFDIHIQVRGSYKSVFGQNYLKLKQEYNVDGARLIKRVFQDVDKIITFRLEQRAEALRLKEKADKELRRLVSGG